MKLSIGVVLRVVAILLAVLIAFGVTFFGLSAAESLCLALIILGVGTLVP